MNLVDMMGMHVDSEGDTRMKMMENRMELMQEEMNDLLMQQEMKTK